MDETLKQQIDETLKDSPVVEETKKTPNQILEEFGVPPQRTYIQEHTETIEVPGYEYPETKLDKTHDVPKSQFNNGTLPDEQQGSFGKEYNFAPVKPYKVFLPTLQEEVTVTTTDPQKAAFELATQYRATDPNQFIGYRYMSNEDLAVELARQTAMLYGSKPSILNIQEQQTFGEEPSWISDTLPVDYLKGLGSFLWDLSGTTAKMLTSTPWTAFANAWSLVDEDTTKRDLIYVETPDGRRYPQIKNADSRADRLWNDAQRFSMEIDRVVGKDTEEFFTLQNPGIFSKIAHGVGNATGSVGLSLANPIVGAGVAAALSYDNIRENALNQGYTYGEALTRAVRGSATIGTLSLVAGTGAAMINKYATKAFADSLLARLGLRAAATTLESTGEVAEEWVEEVESGLAGTTGWKNKFENGLTEDDFVTFISSAIVSMAGLSIDARKAYIDNGNKIQLTDEQKKELSQLSEQAKVFVSTMQKFGFSKDKAREAFIEIVRSGPEKQNELIAKIEAEIKDRQGSIDVQAQLDEINKRFDVKNLQDMYNRGIEAVEANVDAKLADNKEFSDFEKQAFKAIFVPYAVQVSAVTGTPIEQVQIPELKTMKSYYTMGQSTYHGTDKPGVVQINKTAINNDLGHKHPSSFDPFATKEAKRDVIATMAHEMYHQFSHLAADLYPTLDLKNFVGTGVKIVDTVFDATPEQVTAKAKKLDKKFEGFDKTDPNAKQKFKEVSQDTELTRENLQTPPTNESYDSPSNYGEWVAQSLSRAKSEIKNAFGLSDDNEAWAALSEVGRIMDGASSYMPLTEGLKNFVDAWRKFVKDNSKGVINLVKKKGSRKLNKAIRSWLKGDPDAINWDGVTMEDIVELGKLADKPVDAEAISALTKTLSGVPLKDFRKKYVDLHNQIEEQRSGKTETPKENVVSDIEEIDIDELTLDPFEGIVDQDRVLYHGTTRVFDEFDMDKIGSLVGTSQGWGIYATYSKDYAKWHMLNLQERPIENEDDLQKYKSLIEGQILKLSEPNNDSVLLGVERFNSQPVAIQEKLKAAFPERSAVWERKNVTGNAIYWDLVAQYWGDEATSKKLLDAGIVARRYDDQSFVIFTKEAVEILEKIRGSESIADFEKVMASAIRNDLMAQLSDAKKEEKKEETQFQKRINKLVEGRTLEEDFDHYTQMFLNTKTKRGVDAWLSERRGLDGYLFSLGGKEALKSTNLPLKRQAFRDIYDSYMERIRDLVKKEMFDSSDLEYDKFLKTHLAKTIDAEIYDKNLQQIVTRKVSPSEVAYAILAYEQVEANGPLRVRTTWRNLSDVVKQVDPKHFKFAKMLRADLETILREDLKAQSKYGEGVGRVLKNYYPLVTQDAVSDDRPNTTLSFMARKETKAPIGVIGDIEVYGRYMGKIAGGKSKYFQEVQRLSDLIDFKPAESLNDEDRAKATELEAKSRRLRNIIRDKVGSDGLRYIEEYIEQLKNGSATRDLSNGALYKVSKSLTPALLGGRLKNFFANIWNGATWLGVPNVDSYTEYMAEYVKALMNPSESLKETLKIGSLKTGKKGKDGKITPGLGFFANRFANTAINEFTQRGATPTSDKLLNDFAAYLQKKNLSQASDIAETIAWLATKADKIVMLPTTLGDLGGNFIGAAALRRQYIKQNLRKGMSQNDAVAAADDAVIDFVLHHQSSSNQAMKPLSVLKWNKQSAFMSTLAMFTGETTTKAGQIGQDIQAARMGEMSKIDAARDIAAIFAAQLGYRLTQAGVFGGLISALFGDFDEEEQEFIMENLATGIVQDLIDMFAGHNAGIVTPTVLSVLTDKSYGMSNPLASELLQMAKSIKNIGESIIEGEDIEANDLVKAIGKGVSYGVGFPAIDTIVNDARGAYEAAFGETKKERKKGRYMSTGRSESFSEKAAGMK